MSEAQSIARLRASLLLMTGVYLEMVLLTTDKKLIANRLAL